MPAALSPAKLAQHLPQQMAALAVIAVTIGTVWIMASACSAQDRDAVDPNRPAQHGEVVTPPGDEAPNRVPISTLRLCFPLPANC